MIAETTNAVNDVVWHSVEALLELKKPKNMQQKDHNPQTICKHSYLNHNHDRSKLLLDIVLVRRKQGWLRSGSLQAQNSGCRSGRAGRIYFGKPSMNSYAEKLFQLLSSTDSHLRLSCLKLPKIMTTNEHAGMLVVAVVVAVLKLRVEGQHQPPPSDPSGSSTRMGFQDNGAGQVFPIELWGVSRPL